MAFTLPREPGTQETLQCIACAARQEIGSSFGVDDLRDLMRQDGTHNKENAVYQHTGIEPKYMRNVRDWVTDPAKPELLQEWLNSSVWVANSLLKEGLTGKYKFYRQNQFPAPGKSFKDVFNVLKDEIRTSGAKNPNFGKTIAGRIYNNIEMSDDKWNPADIVLP